MEQTIYWVLLGTGISIALVVVYWTMQNSLIE